MTCGGWCWTGLAGCGFGWLPGRLWMALWMCVHGPRVQGEWDETRHMEPESIAGFPGNKPWTVSPLSRWASCQMGAPYLGSNNTHTSRFLKPVQCNHLSNAHNSLLAGEGGIFTAFGPIRNVLRSEWTDSRQVTPLQRWNRCKEVISPGELVSLCLQPLQLYHSTFWGTLRVCFPIRPSLASLSGPFLICLYFLSFLHTVVGMELIHFDQKSFGKRQACRLKPPPQSARASEITHLFKLRQVCRHVFEACIYTCREFSIRCYVLRPCFILPLDFLFIM